MNRRILLRGVIVMWFGWIAAKLGIPIPETHGMKLFVRLSDGKLEDYSKIEVTYKGKPVVVAQDGSFWVEIPEMRDVVNPPPIKVRGRLI